MKSYRYRSLSLTAIVALILATVLFYGQSFISNRTNSGRDEAIATNIDVAILNAPIVITGRVVDGVAVSGTNYRILVSKALKGDLAVGSEISVAVSGGSLGKVKAPLLATLVVGEEYIFTLAQSGEAVRITMELSNPLFFS
ncbi:hypothetical protein [Cohnella sp. OV330]|uniref:hypothetical protein n=1 Tax=Cohnella sp. OV330 TaxID=1855288 RepID=UPI0011602BA2|nr:hypothetical protein [Cohnella sp. OV330]